MNETTVGITFKNSVNGNSKLEKLATNLTNIQTALGNLDTNSLTNLSGSVKNVKSLDTQLKSANKSKSSLTQAADIYKLNAAIKALAGTVKSLSKYVKQSSAYLENLNLFENAFGADYKAAEKFTNKLSEMYGLDESWVVKTTGNFKQLANAMGIAGETGTKLSELLTNMSLDISSLYNIDVEDASSKLQSALAGQTKPVRSIGADITESTLQTTLGNLGIDKTVSELSYAEKRLVIIISLTQQLNTSIGDMGRTIEMPANQMRVLSAQWERLTRAVGNLFLPIVKKVLPYLNAILMVLTEIISAVATLFGYNPEDYNVASTTSNVDDLVDSLDDATDSASNLNNQMKGLRSFDKLNNISTSSSSSSGTSGGSSSGIDTSVLDAFDKAYSSYNSKLADVKMQASDIRDKIMEWLGFTKLTDEATGDISFKFDHITSGTVLGSLIAGGAIYNGVRTILGMLNKMGLIDFQIPSLLELIKGFLSLTGVSGFFGDLGAAFELIGEGSPVLESLGQVAPALGEMLTKLSGVFSIVSGIVILFQGVSDIIKNGWNFDGIMESLEGIALVVAGVLAFVNPLAAAIALAVAGVIKLVQLIVDNWDTIKQFFVDVFGGFYDTVIQPIVDWVTGIAKFVYDYAIKPVIDFFTPIIDLIVDTNTYVIKKVAEIVTGIAKAAWSIISKIGEIFAKIVEIVVAINLAAYNYILKPILEWLGKFASYVYEHAIKPVINKFVNVGIWFYNTVIKPIWDKIVWLKDKAVEIFKKIATTVTDFISGSVKGVINGVLNLIETNINSFIKLLNGAIGIINKIPGVNISKVSLLSIPRLEKGMDFVPKDYYGPVYLDYGERVLTKQENKDYSSNAKVANTNYANSMPSTFNIYVGDSKLTSVVVKDMKKMAKNNGQTLDIFG